MTEKRPPCEERFFSNLKCFENIINDGLKKEKSETITPELVTFAFSLLETMDKETIIRNFIDRTHVLWTQISENRDLPTILDQSFLLFGDLGEDKIHEISRLVISRTDKCEASGELDVAWKLVEGLIRISIRYIYEQRKPYFDKDTGELNFKNPNFFPEIDIVKHARQYRLALVA